MNVVIREVLGVIERFKWNSVTILKIAEIITEKHTEIEAFGFKSPTESDKVIFIDKEFKQLSSEDRENLINAYDELFEIMMFYEILNDSK